MSKTTYQFEIDKEIWDAFKLVAYFNSLKMKDAIQIAILDYIQTYQKKEQNISIQVIKKTERNLISFVYEEEIKNLCSAILEAKQRKASQPYLNGLKAQLMKTIKKHPYLNEELSQEIVSILKTFQD